MVLPLIAAGITAAASLAGGAMRQDAQSNANDQAFDMAMNNLSKQEEFARNSVRWKAIDVMNAYRETGIHPLALLGVQGASYSPVSVAFQPESGMGESIGQMGQDISRSIHAGADRALRGQALALQEMMMNSAAERGQLENELLKTKIASERAQLAQNFQPPPPTVTRGAGKAIIDGQGTTTGFGVEKNIIPDLTVARTPSGGYVLLPSDAGKQRMEDMFGLSAQWFMRNVLQPLWSTDQGEAIANRVLPYLPPTHRWAYSPALGEWNKVPTTYTDRFKGYRRRDLDPSIPMVP